MPRPTQEEERPPAVDRREKAARPLGTSAPRRSRSSAVIDELAADPDVMAEVEQQLSGRTRDIRLKGTLARAFRQRTGRQTANLIRFWLIWIAILDLFVLCLNAVLMPVEFLRDTLAPATVIFVVSLLCAFVWRKPQPRAVLSASLLATTLIIMLSVCVMGLAAGGVMLERYLHVMLSVAITAIIIFPIPILQTLTIAVAAAGLYLWFQLSFEDLALNSVLSGFFFFAGGLAATVLARRTSTIFAHQAFLLELRDRLHMVELARMNDRLDHLAKIDVLTGLANRRAFQEEFESMCEGAARVGVLMCDIDDFKVLNDTLGHSEGDRCLAAIARLVAEVAETEGGFAARYGGEEFAVLLADADEDAAVALAEQIRDRIESAALHNPGSSMSGQVTMSIGVAVDADGSGRTSPDALVDSADRALYRAKREGRNRVCLWTAGDERRQSERRMPAG